MDICLALQSSCEHGMSCLQAMLRMLTKTKTTFKVRSCVDWELVFWKYNQTNWSMCELWNLRQRPVSKVLAEHVCWCVQWTLSCKGLPPGKTVASVDCLRVRLLASAPQRFMQRRSAVQRVPVENSFTSAVWWKMVEVDAATRAESGLIKNAMQKFWNFDYFGVWNICREAFYL